MVDSIPTLLTVEECDRQLGFANNALVVMQYERTQVDKKNGTAVTEGPNYEKDLQSTLQQISFYETSLPAMPDGPGKDVQKGLLEKLYVKRTTLLGKKENYGTDSLFEQQGEFTALGGKITAFLTFIAAVNARKAEL